MTSDKIHRCPQCRQSCRIGKKNPYSPFCSERCKLMDLGDWLDERHVISEPLNRWDSPTDDSSPE